jgi:hypothetical protein
MILLFLLSISGRVLRWVLKPVARPIAGMLLLFLVSFSSFPVAQSKSDARLRLLSVNQGETIVQAAWELRRGLNPKPDCSHFIQAVYAKAGFVYDYATTREIFTGIDGFRRVQHPQPGDLVVWQGHMGIIIDPNEHSFYSSVLSGFAIENYQSNYWQARLGHPRFYRFVVKNPQSAPRTILANSKKVLPASKQPLLRPVSTEEATVAVAPQVSSQKPDLTVAPPASSQKPPVMATVADSHVGASRQAPPASTEKAPLAVARQVSGQKPAVADSTKIASRQSVQIADSTKRVSQQPAQIANSTKVTSQLPEQTVDSPKGVSRQPAQMAAQLSADEKVKVEADGKTAAPDTVIHNEIFVTSQATPSRREVLAAIIRAADDNGEHLLRGRLLDWQPLVGIVDGFRLVSLDVQGNSGLAEVEVTQIAAFRNGKPSSSRLSSTRRVILSRQQQGWILVTPQELLYLNHQQATKALTDQLAALSKTPADQLQAKKTARILHELQAAKSPGDNPGGSD